MNITNLLKPVLALSLILVLQNAQAQSEETEERKVVIVEKVVDENGNETVNERILEGEEAEAYLRSKEMKIILDEELDIEKLKEELEDVQNVYSNLRITDEAIQELETA